MYGREYRGRVLHFEPSGGLIHASLVMQDKESDSYWSIMTGTALAGELKGTHLQELPLGTKTQWRDWRAQHPETKVLSVAGQEHVLNNPYDNYFQATDGFRGMEARDERLPTKAPIYAFQLELTPYGVPYTAFENGRSFQIGDVHVFLYRPADVAIFYSTLAFLDRGEGFELQDGEWIHRATQTRFDPRNGGFSDEVQRLDGFDTFWFNWSMTYPDTALLTAE